jgi:transposase-like protein
LECTLVSDLTEHHTVGLQCPTCGRDTPKTIDWLKAHDRFVCEHCGRTVFVDKDDLVLEVHRVEDAARRLGL